MKVHANPIVLPNFIRMQDTLASKMTQHFKSLKDDVTKEGPWNSIQTALEDVIVYNRLEAYKKGALLVGRSPIQSDILRLRKDGIARAEWVASEMKHWTQESLQASKKSRLLSKERANKSAVFESRKAFYDGSLKGWSLNKVSKKSWLVSTEYHDKDDQCDDNEDDGIIAIGEVFSTGDAVPPAHNFCYCTVWLHT